jgi:DNA-binding beta-propeller fold protein YncE
LLEKGEKVKRVLGCWLIVIFAVGLGSAQTKEPLTLIQTIVMPDVPLGPYTDHLAADLKGKRLFATPQAHKSVYVFDLATGRFIKDIPGFGNPHSILYRADVDQILVTDGGTGQLKIFSGVDYRLLKAVQLLPDADSIGYDAATQHLYVTNGGEGAKLEYSALSDIDTDNGVSVGEVKIQTKSLEAMALESAGTKIYINLTDKNEIAVIDRQKHLQVASWPVTKGKHNIAMALDEQHHRLFVGCRNSESTGVLVVFDTQTGKELQALPLAGWVDYIAFDAKTQRIYATCGSTEGGTGAVYVYAEKDADHYEQLGIVPTAPRGKTGLYAPEMHRLFVAIPHYGVTEAKILVFQVN